MFVSLVSNDESIKRFGYISLDILRVNILSCTCKRN